ncbi:MAG: hypothetical protein ACYCZM_02010, partial [Acidimicrobiales bacterium]
GKFRYARLELLPIPRSDTTRKEMDLDLNSEPPFRVRSELLKGVPSTTDGVADHAHSLATVLIQEFHGKAGQSVNGFGRAAAWRSNNLE